MWPTLASVRPRVREPDVRLGRADQQGGAVRGERHRVLVQAEQIVVGRHPLHELPGDVGLGAMMLHLQDVAVEPLALRQRVELIAWIERIHLVRLLESVQELRGIAITGHE